MNLDNFAGGPTIFVAAHFLAATGRDAMEAKDALLDSLRAEIRRIEKGRGQKRKARAAHKSSQPAFAAWIIPHGINVFGDAVYADD